MNRAVRRRLLLLTVGGLACVALAVAAPLAVILGASRLAVTAVLATGAWVSVRRLGGVDLATGAAALAGASAGGVAAELVGLPVALGIIPAVVAGGLVSAGVSGVAARVGRAPSALTSLAVTMAAVALGSAWGAAGGRAGFHAVPLITGSDRGDLLVAVVVLAGVIVVVDRWSAGRSAATGSVAVRAAHAAASLGHRPVLAAARAGAVAGAVLGVGGWLQAATSGSVVPGGHGLGLSASLALAALIGGRSALSGTVGALVVFGPGVLWPAAPIIGSVPVLVVGVVGLAVLAIRPQGLLPRPRRAPTAAMTRPDAPDGAHPGPERPQPLIVARTPLPGGHVSFEVEPGEIVAVVGPNGSGKSTLLARIAGQLPDGGVVRIGDEPAPAGAVARARCGVARTWQHPPSLPAGDGLATAVRGGDDAAAAAAARSALGEHADAPSGRDLVRLAARRPSIALLDEPGASLPPDRVIALVRALAASGSAVLVAEHRAEVVTAADRRVDLGRGGGPPGRTPAAPPVSGGGGPLVVEVQGARVGVAPGEVEVIDDPVGGRLVAAVRGERRDPSLRISIGGRRLPSGRPHPLVRAGLGIVTDVPPPGDVTVRDHLAAVAGPRDADRLLAAAPLLAGRGGDPTGVLSGGERRVLAWLVCVAVAPDAVLLDRATAGLDDAARRWAQGIVAAWRDAGVPVVVHPGHPAERGWSRPT